MKKQLLTILTAITITATAQVPNYVPTTGLVAYYGFNGNANDLSGNGNNGTVTGATLTTDRFGNNSSAYSFNGANNQIAIANSTSLNIQNFNGISMAVWVKYNVLSSPSALLNFHQGDGQNINYVLEYGNTYSIKVLDI